MVEAKKDSLIKDLILDLASKDNKTLMSALKRVRSKGSEKVIPSLFNLIEKNEDELIKNEAQSIILELKSTASIPFLLEQLSNKNEAIRLLALNAFWQTGFNSHENMDKFVTAAINGSYMEAFEAYTIIENLDGPFEEENIMEAQLVLKSYFSVAHEDEEKFPIMKNIAKQLADFELSIQ
jgi:HEAT repeat protein